MSRDFLQFCQAHGLIGAGAITAPGLTKRCTTTCNTSRENGWWRYDGRTGVCGIWGSLTAQQYRPGADAKPLSKAEREAIAARARQAADLERIKHASAATKAAAMLAASDMRSHAYIARKGFPELLTPCANDGATLLVTMWQGKRLVNLQRINEAGEKRFLHGGEVTGTAHVIGSEGVPLLCEGYATGLSVAAAIKASRLRAHTVICFSAGNMVNVATRYKDARVVADNDKSLTGEKAAQATGLRYWMPPDVGTDANDYHRKHGLFALSQRVRELILSK